MSNFIANIYCKLKEAYESMGQFELWIFGLFFAAFLWIVTWLFRTNRVKIRRYWRRIGSWGSWDLPLQEDAIRESLRVCSDNLDKEPAITAIKNGKWLVENQKFIFQFDDKICSTRFHLYQALDTRVPHFFEAGCREIGSKLVDGQISSIVFLANQTNRMMARDVAGVEGFSQRIKSLELRPQKDQRSPYLLEYEGEDSLSGERVIVIDALVYSPTPLEAVVNMLCDNGASIQGIGVLVDASGQGNKLDIALNVPITRAFALDLHFLEANEVNKLNKEIKRIEFYEYQ